MSVSICVASGKGGAGKSTVTANLGACLARRGHTVTIIDTDIGLRSQDALLSLENQVVYDLVDVASKDCRLDQALLNRGYMTEAVSLLTDYAFSGLGLHRIEANVMPRNARSLRVLEKCGFHPEGLAQRYLQINGVWEDHIHMVRLNDAWQPRTED